MKDIEQKMKKYSEMVRTDHWIKFRGKNSDFGSNNNKFSYVPQYFQEINKESMQTILEHDKNNSIHYKNENSLISLNNNVKNGIIGQSDIFKSEYFPDKNKNSVSMSHRFRPFY